MIYLIERIWRYYGKHGRTIVMTKRLTQKQIKHISDLYYDYEIYELLKYVDELCEYNFKQGVQNVASKDKD